MLRLVATAMLVVVPIRADEAALAEKLRELARGDLAKLAGKDGKYSTLASDFMRAQIAEANQRDREAWSKVKSRQDWERFRQPRIEALKRHLTRGPAYPKTIRQEVPRTIVADDYRIDLLLYESRPGLWVTSNLYYPARPTPKSPLIVIVHSHHNPKHEGELQDMGVTWAKLGCHVLCIDLPGHGERRQHPFRSAKDFEKDYRVGRQDYYFRYNLHLQATTFGQSLMDWMVWDLMRGIDVVLERPAVDRDRIIMLGSVAGGGDIAAVTAAVDNRIACVAPFNFGGPQPETRFPLPDNAEQSFNYLGSGSWESTRNLRDSALEGHLPWAIVASIAPRKLIHAHEFSWDQERDPVWKRYQQIWGFYNATDNLAFTHGTGVIHGNDPNASHCNNIGPIHRRGIYVALKRWFDIPIPEKEARERRPASDLTCWAPDMVRQLKPKSMQDSFARYWPHTPDHGGDSIQRFMYRPREGAQPPLVTPKLLDRQEHNLRVDVVVQTLQGQITPFRVVVLRPRAAGSLPVVLCLSQEGPARFLQEHALAISKLVHAGIEVVLLEWEASGAYRIGDDRGRGSSSTWLESTAQMLGMSLSSIRSNNVVWAADECRRPTGSQVPNSLAVWAESFAPVNGDDVNVAIPHDLKQPSLVEPLAGLLGSHLPAQAFLMRNVLYSYRSILHGPFIHVPMDAIPPRGAHNNDTASLWSAVGERARLEGLVDATNRRVSLEQLRAAVGPKCEIHVTPTDDASVARWLEQQLKRR